MKKLFISAAAMMLAVFAAGAQVVSVSAPQRVDGVEALAAVISPDGSFAVVTDNGGLSKVDLTSGATTQVAKGQAFYGVKISADGQKVVYNRPVFKNKLRYVTLEGLDMANGKVDVLVKPTRHLNAGITMAGNTVNAVENGKSKVKALDGAKAQQAPVASINYGHLDVTVNGQTRTIDPQGRASYIWPSISADGTRVLYRMVGKGTFTCNLDGTDVRYVGNLMTPVWAGNDIVIGVDEKEGTNQVLTAASLVAVDMASGKSQVLTSEDILATAPSVSADGSRLTFVTPDGALYVMNLNK